MTNNKLIIGTIVVLGVAGFLAVISLQSQVSDLQEQNEDILNKLNTVDTLENNENVVEMDNTFDNMFSQMRGGIITQTCGFEGEEEC